MEEECSNYLIQLELNEIKMEININFRMERLLILSIKIPQ